MTYDPYFITTAIPFVNGRPHLGHALEFVIADAIARYRRQRGRDVYFLTGTDENSLKNVRAAEAEGIPTQTLVDRNAGYFAALGRPLDLSNDDFIRTSVDPRHAPGVHKLWRACAAAGDIYKKTYGGLYCVGCEQFYAEDELDDGRCPEHLRPPEWVEEENYFFRLSRYQQPLLDLVESGALRIVPEQYKQETLSFIRGGLADFSISRSVERAHGWGVSVPDDPSQVIYVWYDALSNYITALDYAAEGACYRRYWAQNPDRVHVIGKGILRFHAVYWPAMLLSAGVPLPTTIYVHGYITAEGQKISKSLGNAIDPVAIAETYGTDSLRYYLLREIRTTDDGDFSRARFVHTHNRDLADQLGNLLNRVVGMVARYCDGRVPAPGAAEAVDQALIRLAEGLPGRLDAAVDAFELHTAMATVWELVGAANKYVDQTEPWVLAKRRMQDDAPAEARLQTVLYNLVEALRLIAYYARPFVPATAEKIARQLNVALDGAWEAAVRWGGVTPGTGLQPGEVLFPKF